MLKCSSPVVQYQEIIADTEHSVQIEDIVQQSGHSTAYTIYILQDVLFVEHMMS